MQTIADDCVQAANASDEWHWTGDGWDRRSATRLDLNYPLRVRRTSLPREIETKTKNVSHCGFYFSSSAPFRPQERVEYEIVMPWSASKGVEPVDMVLRGFARIVRVEASRPGVPSGIACRLEGDYTISRHDEEKASLMRPAPPAAAQAS